MRRNFAQLQGCFSSQSSGKRGLPKLQIQVGETQSTSYPHAQPLSIIAMSISNPDRPSFGING
ncbi:MAG: hypothetical protein DME99_11545 [Verrucomicrobia bacterium]|nr:MAG: hypothetical protein DME99_11545 [Verrucomicrobiota bacterium]